MRKPKRLLTEFAIRVWQDGTISWDGFDRVMWRWLHGHLPQRIAILSNKRSWRRPVRTL